GCGTIGSFTGQLAVAVAAPAVDAPAVSDAARVGRAGLQPREQIPTGHRYRRSAARRPAVAQLAGGAGAPAGGFSGAAYSTGEVAAGSELREAPGDSSRGGHVPAVGGSAAQSTAVVQARREAS